MIVKKGFVYQQKDNHNHLFIGLSSEKLLSLKLYEVVSADCYVLIEFGKLSSVKTIVETEFEHKLKR